MELAPCGVPISLPPIPEAAQREQLKPATHVGRPASLPRGQASPFARRAGGNAGTWASAREEAKHAATCSREGRSRKPGVLSWTVSLETWTGVRPPRR